MPRRVHAHAPPPSHHEELLQAMWGLVMGCCFAFPVAAAAALAVGTQVSRTGGLIAFASITLAGAVATALWSARRARGG